jgi:hypothetical protein
MSTLMNIEGRKMPSRFPKCGMLVARRGMIAIAGVVALLVFYGGTAQAGSVTRNQFDVRVSELHAGGAVRLPIYAGVVPGSVPEPSSATMVVVPAFLRLFCWFRQRK